eukprot:COSAG02_NODE_4201_length_5632_cov_5.111874_3_plen_203_part_00
MLAMEASIAQRCWTPPSRTNARLARRIGPAQCSLDWTRSALDRTLHDTVLKRYRVAAGSARTIHDYLYPPRLPSLPRFFHHSRLFSIARSLLPHDSAMEIATGIAPARPLSRPTQTNSPTAPNSLTATQLPTHPALKKSHRHQSNHQSKFWTRGPGPKTFRNSLLYIYLSIILLISSLEKFHITCPSRSMVHLLWISGCVCE